MAPKKSQAASKRKVAAESLEGEMASDHCTSDLPPPTETYYEDQGHKKPKAIDRSDMYSGDAGDSCDELPQDQMARAGLAGTGSSIGAITEEDPERAAFLDRSPAVITQANADLHADRRVMSGAAALGAATGLVLSGPIAGAALGVAAAYSTTRGDQMGTATRKAGGVCLQAQDLAIDHGIELLDKAVDEGKKFLETQKDNRSVPAPVRAGLKMMLEPRRQSHEVLQANLAEAKKMRERYPDRVPIICEKSPISDLPELPKKKFIIPGAMPCGEFKYIMHKQLQQAQAERFKAEQTIYIFVNGFAPKASTPISELYDQYKSEDGFMYITYQTENTLG